MTRMKLMLGVLLAILLMIVVAPKAAEALCDEESCTLLVWKEDSGSDCTSECDDACGGEEYVQRVSDLQTNCECLCSESGGQCTQTAKLKELLAIE